MMTDYLTKNKMVPFTGESVKNNLFAIGITVSLKPMAQMKVEIMTNSALKL